MTITGGLVFFGRPEGEFLTLGDDTGEVLWSFQAGSGILGKAITQERYGAP